MPNFFSDVGRSSAGSDIQTTLGTMVNLKRMGDEAAITREKLGMARESHAQDMAIGREQYAQIKMKNEAEAKEQAFLDERIPVDDAFGGLKSALLPEDYDTFRKSIGKASEDGVTISRRNQHSLLDELRKDPTRIDQLKAAANKKSVFAVQTANEEMKKAYDAYKKKGDEDSYKKYTEAKGKYVAATAQAGKVTEAISNAELQIGVMNQYEEMAKDPETKKLLDQNPLFKAAIEAGDFKSAHQEMANIRTERGKAAAEAQKLEMEKRKQEGRKELLRIRNESIDRRKKMGKDTSPEAKQKRLSQIAVQRATLRKSAGDPDLNPDVQGAMEALDEEEKELRAGLGKPKKEPSRVKEGVSYLKKAKDREDVISKIKALAAKGWSREDLAAAAKEAGWE